MKKFFIKIFGCQYNEWEGTRLSGVLTRLGLIESAQNDADIVFIINCSVRKTAVDRAMSWTKNLIKDNKIVIICGCVLEDDKKIFLDKGARIWDGSNFDELKKILSLENDIAEIGKLFETSQNISNLIPITKGCDNFCSYCAVPYTRGREISRPMDEIIENIKKVLENGHKEIILLGQNVNSYKYGFAQLLKSINDLAGDFQIKFISNHPKDMNDDIIEAIATLPKVKKEIHLPLQSGSNKILKAMNRPYTKEQYLELVKKIKKKIPNVILTTDTIVGFPGETEEDFQQTVDLFKQVDFSQSFNNKYSPRSSTVAFKLGDPIPWEEKERHWRVLNELVNKR